MAWYRQSQGLWFITGLLLFGAVKIDIARKASICAHRIKPARVFNPSCNRFVRMSNIMRSITAF